MECSQHMMTHVQSELLVCHAVAGQMQSGRRDASMAITVSDTLQLSSRRLCGQPVGTEMLAAVTSSDILCGAIIRQLHHSDRHMSL